MNVLINIVTVVQVLSALGVIGLVLLQHGKGADMGASFGSGASGSLFGATGSANFLSRSTAICAAIFFASTLMLTYFSSHRVSADSSSVLDRPAVAASAASSAASAAPVPLTTGSAPVVNESASEPAATASSADSKAVSLPQTAASSASQAASAMTK